MLIKNLETIKAGDLLIYDGDEVYLVSDVSNDGLLTISKVGRYNVANGVFTPIKSQPKIPGIRRIIFDCKYAKEFV